LQVSLKPFHTRICSVYDNNMQLSSSIVLSQSVCVQHLSYKKDFRVNYKYFHSRGLQKSVIEMVVLEYLKIQLHLNLTSQVTICGVSGICTDDLKFISLYNILISFLQSFNSVLFLPKKKKNRTLAKSNLENLFSMLLILACIQVCSPYMHQSILYQVCINPGKILCSILE
jgi:hypothetical protein